VVIVKVISSKIPHSGILKSILLFIWFIVVIPLALAIAKLNNASNFIQYLIPIIGMLIFFAIGLIKTDKN